VKDCMGSRIATGALAKVRSLWGLVIKIAQSQISAPDRRSTDRRQLHAQCGLASGRIASAR
jgi:hypothetical protein